MSPQELAELDLAVAQIEARTWNEKLSYDATRDRAEALRLLEKYGLNLGRGEHGWWAWHPLHNRQTRPSETPAIAICRAVVALRATESTMTTTQTTGAAEVQPTPLLRNKEQEE